MSYQKIAELIPAEYRKEILELNMIDDAVAAEGNANMNYLIVIWKDYIEKDFSADCNLCRSRVLKNMYKIKDILIQMEKNSKLLNNS